MLNIVLIVVLSAIALIGVLHYNIRNMQIELPKQEITIKMNKEVKEQLKKLNCSGGERSCLNKYKAWLRKNSHRLQDIVHVDNYRALFGEAPITSVKELIRYSSAYPEASNFQHTPLLQNSYLPAPQKL